jgi:hypothetical protein
MADKSRRELYSFTVEIPREVTKEVEVEREVEVEKEVEKKRKRKNKETGKMETYTEKSIQPVKEKQTVIEERTVTEESPVKIIFKRPTRTQLEDGDMFYSIWLNKFIKMGLLTRAMLAKQHIDIGGTLDEEEKQYYSGLYVKLYEKQMELQRFALTPEDDMSDSLKEKRQATIGQVGLIRKELTDFETVQASMFEHTADIKARNKTITWYLLHLAQWQDLSNDENDVQPMFAGDDFDEKYDAYKSKEESDDEIFWHCIDKLTSIATIWYMSGVQDKEDFDTLLDEVTQEAALDETGTLTE